MNAADNVLAAHDQASTVDMIPEVEKHRGTRDNEGRLLDEGGLSLLSPEDGASFTDPRTIKFKAMVDTSSLTNLLFVFENLEEQADQIPITVDATDIVQSVATERVGGFANGHWTWIVQGKDANGNVIKTDPRTFQVQGVNS